MKFLVLGITGSRGSGKDTVANYLRSKYRFRILTYTNDVLSPILKKRGLDVTRENLINLALEMRRKNGKDALTVEMCRKIKHEGFWAISGVRYPEEHDYFRKCFNGDFRLVDVECSAKKRHERVVRRGTKGEAGMTFEKFMEIEEKETERIIEETVKLADFRINNNGTISQLNRKIDDLAKKLGIAASS
jgi:dephospho-CoA kinase